MHSVQIVAYFCGLIVYTYVHVWYICCTDIGQQHFLAFHCVGILSTLHLTYFA